MKVILISKTVNFGDIGDIVDVKNGFARNYLIPKKKAICYTQANYKLFEEKKKQFESENKKNFEAAEEIKSKVNNKDIIIIENASDDGRLYGSVNTNIIADEISKTAGKNKLISRSNIVLEKPIKEVGVYNITLNLHSDVSFKLRLIVSRNKSEVKNLIDEFEGKKVKEKAKIKEETNKEEVEVTAKEEKVVAKDSNSSDKKEDTKKENAKKTKDDKKDAKAEKKSD